MKGAQANGRTVHEETKLVADAELLSIPFVASETGDIGLPPALPYSAT